MDYKYLDCDFQPCELYTSADSEKCEYLSMMQQPTATRGMPYNNRGYTVYKAKYPGSRVYVPKY